jgi:hypothetical protein
MTFLNTRLPVTPLLTHGCKQVYRSSQRNPSDVTYLCEPDVCKCAWQQRWCFWAHIFPSPPSSLTYVHMCIGSPNSTRQTLSTSVKLTYLCVWQQRWCFWSHILPVDPLLDHSCTQVHRFSKHNPTDTVYLCTTDVSKCVWQQRWRFWTRNFPVIPLLTHTCTQVHRFSQRNPVETSSPSPPSSLTHVRRCIRSHNTTR